MSDSIIIQNSVISNDDDCVSFKPNSTNIVVQDLHCTDSHGISVGSLGQYLGEVDIAGLCLFIPKLPRSELISETENLYIYNATMTTSSDAARIKIWSGNIPSKNSTSSGGGTGYLRNVTYNTIYDVSDNCESRKFDLKNMRVLTGGIDAIELTQCYSLSNLTLCNEYPVSHHFGLLCPKS
jgi:galacturan 1,4-alpha-galacturonidase